jgi:hypothetical protein
MLVLPPLENNWQLNLGGIEMNTEEFRTVTNEVVQGIVIAKKDSQNVWIIQDKEGYFHVVSKTA